MAFRMATLRRDKSGSWTSRKAIPEDVRPAFRGRWEVRFYARADCPRDHARVLFSEWQADIDNQITAARAKQRGEGHDLTQRDARALAGECYRWFTSQHEENPGRPHDWDGARWAFEHVMEEATRDPETGEIGDLDMDDPEVRKYVEEEYPYLTKTANEFLISRGEALTPAAMTMFIDELISELHTAMVRLERMAGGDYSPDQHVLTLPPYSKSPVARRLGKTVSAMQLFQGYILAKKLADGSVRQWRPVFTMLDTYLAGRDFDALSDDEAQKWLDSLVTDGRSAATVQTTYVAALKAIGGWGRKKHLISRNPFVDSKVDVPKKTHNRETKAFSTEEIRLILSAANAVNHIRTTGMAARRWVPWICAYSGARAGEITQLRGQDVIERDGIQALKITPEAGSTKTRVARTVPIHEHLIAQGFLEYVKAKGMGPLFYNPPRSNGSAIATADTDITRPKRSPSLSARDQLGKWVRSATGVADNEVGPTHGWRHTFTQIAERNGIPERVLNAITGWASQTTGGRYGKPTLQGMAEALNRFPRYEVG
jgi:integrase